MAFYPSAVPNNLSTAIGLWSQFMGPEAAQREQAMEAQKQAMGFAQAHEDHAKGMRPGEQTLQQQNIQQGELTLGGMKRKDAIEAGSHLGRIAAAKVFDAYAPPVVPLRPQPLFPRDKNISQAEASEEQRKAFADAMPPEATPDMHADLWKKGMEDRTGRPTEIPGMFATGVTEVEGKRSVSYIPKLDPLLASAPGQAGGSAGEVETAPLDLSKPLAEIPPFKSRPSYSLKTGEGGRSYYGIGEQPLTVGEMAVLTKYPEAVYSHLPQARQEMGAKFVEHTLKLGREDREMANKLFENLNNAPPVKKYYDASSMYNSLRAGVIAQRTAIAEGREPTGADDVAIVFGFMKTIEPNSTVREGEYATAQNTGGVDDKVVTLYNSLMRGEKLTQDQRENFLAAGGRSMVGHVNMANQLRQQYLNQAKASGLKEGSIVTPEFKPPEGVEAAKTGSGASKEDPFIPKNKQERDEALAAGKWVGDVTGKKVAHKDQQGFRGHGASGSWELPLITPQDVGPLPPTDWARPHPQLPPGPVLPDEEMRRAFESLMRPRVTRPN